MKRKGGLFKKAHELSVLCSVDVAVFIFGSNKKLYEYSSGDMRELITRYQFVRVDHPSHLSSLVACTDGKSPYSMAAPTSIRVPATSTAGATTTTTKISTELPPMAMKAPSSLR